MWRMQNRTNQWKFIPTLVLTFFPTIFFLIREGNEASYADQSIPLLLFLPTLLVEILSCKMTQKKRRLKCRDKGKSHQTISAARGQGREDYGAAGVKQAARTPRGRVTSGCFVGKLNLGRVWRNHSEMLFCILRTGEEGPGGNSHQGTIRGRNGQVPVVAEVGCGAAHVGSKGGLKISDQEWTQRLGSHSLNEGSQGENTDCLVLHRHRD